MVRPLTCLWSPRRAGLAAALCALAGAPGQSAHADQFDTINFTAGSLLRYESNVFRSPDSATGPAGHPGKDDTASISYARVAIDKPYSLQRFQLSATDTVTRYNAFTFLDNNALDYRAAWLWSVTPHLTGVLSADRTQTQIPFTLTSGGQRNVQTTNNRNFNFDGWVSGAWHLIGGYGQTESTTEQTILSVPSYRSHRVEGGLRYVTTAGNSLSFIQRAIPSELVNQALDPVNLIDTNYRDTESELKGFWQPGGKSTLDASVTHKRRRNEHFAQRDFSGVVGELRFGWAPTGKLRFSASAARNLLPYAAFGNIVENSTYRVDNTLSLVAIWQADAKITVQAKLADTLSDYRGPVFAITGPARKDEYRIAQIKADWAIARYLSLNTSVEYNRRLTNIPGFEFSDVLFTLGGVLTF